MSKILIFRNALHITSFILPGWEMRHHSISLQGVKIGNNSHSNECQWTEKLRLHHPLIITQCSWTSPKNPISYLYFPMNSGSQPGGHHHSRRPIETSDSILGCHSYKLLVTHSGWGPAMLSPATWRTATNTKKICPTQNAPVSEC